MAKINITKVTGDTESLNLISAFKSDGTIKVVFDSERIGSMGLPIIYISKYTDKLEKIVDDNEWQSVKNNLKGIINGTNFEYVTIPENVSSDDVYYTPLTLPAVSFDAIKNNYAPIINNATPIEPVMPNNNVASNTVENITPVVNNIPNSPSEVPVIEQVAPQVSISPTVVQPVSMPEVPIVEPVVTQPTMPEVPTTPSVAEVKPVINSEPIVDTSINLTAINFDTDKETFLKACENMFDALVSKYQKELMDLEKREKEISIKEQEINNKMMEASEALANAKSREEVANIAHDNAQKVMDFSSIMPHPTNNN